MRSEHHTTADEFDLASSWRRLLVSFERAGTAKRIKVRSHRHDRRIAKTNAVRDWRDEY
ncbi:hypothetical protein HH308_09655 [Gordonia sp. TBRC 11910]|uniref:Uncharacterized protein n=1 Tax=Gordonia asplenii TaxID=2725283 RepID=A0A848KS17_9ACTN|nr:hypothetical protein [Gordonia asplenii]NMO01476.1 hypothetical protein [Gordonia asplenii]